MWIQWGTGERRDLSSPPHFISRKEIQMRRSIHLCSNPIRADDPDRGLRRIKAALNQDKGEYDSPEQTFETLVNAIREADFESL